MLYMIQNVNQTNQININVMFYYEKCKNECNFHHIQAEQASPVGYGIFYVINAYK